MGKITVTALQEMKRKGTRIVCLTAYDAAFAGVLDSAGVDVILVGDSLGMVLQGADTTLAVTLQDMIYHSRMVKAGCRRALIVTDMPYMSYATPARALGNAERLLGEGGAEVVKLEGGAVIADTVSHLSQHGIAVCGHLGLTPQSIHKLGGYHVQGREEKTAKQISNEARLLEKAGAMMLVLECVPPALAAEITGMLTIPVIGIGAGKSCDGQVLVLHDMLGISSKQPRFSKNFLAGNDSIQLAVENYVSAVRSGEFPATEHQF
jgi:3-methyl-2-oxobutanoate hydroxymethyltransferase